MVGLPRAPKSKKVLPLYTPVPSAISKYSLLPAALKSCKESEYIIVPAPLAFILAPPLNAILVVFRTFVDTLEVMTAPAGPSDPDKYVVI